MHIWSKIRHTVCARQALSALLAILFLLAPVVDGAVCAADLMNDPAKQVASVSIGDMQQPNSAYDGTCVHGHLHEVARMPVIAFLKQANLTSLKGSMFREPPMKRYLPGTLERPPRA